jgi:large subunit ribosomal protein L9
MEASAGGGGETEWRRLKVILLSDVKGQGKKDQMIDVSDGYARNFLLPRKLAIEANASNMNAIKGKEEAQRHRRESELKDARELEKKLKGIMVKIRVKGGAAGKLFGSVTSREIAAALAEQFQIDLDKRKIVLEDGIKSFGTYVLDVKIYPEVLGKLNVLVIDADEK